MNEKEREQRIKELSEQEIDDVDFSKIWDNIKHVVEQPRPKPQKTFKWKYLAASFAACIIICCSITIPLALKNNQGEIIYYLDNLVYENVFEQQFIDDIENSKTDFVDLNKDNAERFVLYKTEERIVKGGKLTFTEMKNSVSFMVSLQFACIDVEIEDETIYDQSCMANGVNVQYKQLSENNGIYKYKTLATYKDVNYLCEIMTNTQDLTIFFNDFFAE